MKRTSINPSQWGLNFGLDQGESIEGFERVIHCSGQCSIVDDTSAVMGCRVDCEGDLRGQMQKAMAHIDAVLEKGGMSRKDIIFLRFYTTDMDGFMANYDAYAEWIGPTGLRPPQTLLGVNRLALPEMLVEIEAVAAV